MVDISKSGAGDREIRIRVSGARVVKSIEGWFWSVKFVDEGSAGVCEEE